MKGTISTRLRPMPHSRQAGGAGYRMSMAPGSGIRVQSRRKRSGTSGQRMGIHASSGGRHCRSQATATAQRGSFQANGKASLPRQDTGRPGRNLRQSASVITTLKHRWHGYVALEGVRSRPQFGRSGCGKARRPTLPAACARPHAAGWDVRPASERKRGRVLSTPARPSMPLRELACRYRIDSFRFQ